MEPVPKAPLTIVQKVVADVKTVRGALTAIVLVALVLFVIFLLPDLLNLKRDYDTLKADFDKVNAKNATFQQQYVQLQNGLAVAKSESTTKDKDLKTAQDKAVQYFTMAMSNAHDKAALQAALQKAQDSLKALGFTPVEASTGSGQVNLTGKLLANLTQVEAGDSVLDDDWLKLTLGYDRSKNMLGIDYAFNFEVFDAAISYQNSDNNRITLYTVGLKSLSNPSQAMWVQGYKREQVNLKPHVDIIRWFDPKLNLDLFPAQGLHGGLAFTFITVAFGDTQKDVLLMLPSIGVASNYKDSGLLDLAARLNIAHFLPLFSDLHIVLGYGYRVWGTQQGLFLIGIGTTI